MSYLVRGSILAAAGAALTLFAAPAFAQYAPAVNPTPPPRVGWELGFGLYGGEINCENENPGNFCEGATEAGGFDLHANYFLSPKLGISLDIWPMFHTEDRVTLTHTVVTVAAKWRPVPIVTLTAGLGSARASWKYDSFIQLEDQTDTVPAVMFAAAIEVVRGSSFAIDLQARIGAGFYDEDNNDNGQADIVGRNVGFGAAMTYF